MAQTISVLAGSLGLSADTVRYYERRGLLPPPRRSDAGYRLYDERDGQRIHFIKAAQRMGLRLGDIKELLEVRDRGLCPCGHTKTLVDRRLAEVEAEITELTAMRAQLRELSRRNEGCVDDRAGHWVCHVGLEKGGANDEGHS